MPELPEVETIRFQLDQFLKNLKIVDLKILNSKNFLGQPEKVIGKRILGVKRRAKITLIELEGGICLAVHLKLTGQLIYRDERVTGDQKKTEKEGPFEVSELPNKFTRVIFCFDNGGRLYFNDLRAFGWIKVISNKNCEIQGGKEIPELAKLGPEANDEKGFTLDYFREILSKTKKPVKLVLLDQEKLAGVGNIYANEALFQAGISPVRPANSLSTEKVEKLRNEIIKVLNEAIKFKGTSDRDEAYRQVTGEKGEFQKHLKVYGKAGQKCPRCEGVIKRITVGGRGTFICPRCQK